MAFQWLVGPELCLALYQVPSKPFLETLVAFDFLTDALNTFGPSPKKYVNCLSKLHFSDVHV